MPGARCARSRACSVVNTRVSHHGHTGNTRHSPRNGFNGFLRALPGDRAFLPPSQVTMRKHRHQVDASVEASGSHDFAVRQRHRSSFGAFASIASRPTFVTMANAPLSSEMARGLNDDLPDELSEIFLQRGLDRANHVEGVRKNRVLAQAARGRHRPFRESFVRRRHRQTIELITIIARALDWLFVLPSRDANAA